MLEVQTYPSSSSTVRSHKQTLHSRADVSHGARRGVRQELQLPTIVQMHTSVCAELYVMAPALSGATMAICIPQGTARKDAGQGLSARACACVLRVLGRLRQPQPRLSDTSVGTGGDISHRLSPAQPIQTGL